MSRHISGPVTDFKPPHPGSECLSPVPVPVPSKLPVPRRSPRGCCARVHPPSRPENNSQGGLELPPKSRLPGLRGSQQRISARSDFLIVANQRLQSAARQSLGCAVAYRE